MTQQDQLTQPLVVVVDESDAYRAFTRDLLLHSGRVHVVGTVRDLVELQRLAAADPDIVLLDISAAPHDARSAILQVREMCPRCEVILTADADTQFELSDAIVAGARGMVRKRIAANQLLGLIQGVFEAEQAKRRHLEHSAKHTTEGGRGGKVITVCSAKGGVGCTTIATNLALALRHITQASVALVDFDLQFGDVDVLLDLQSGHGVHELVRSADDLDASILDAVMTRHPSGVNVLLPPPNLELLDHLTPDALVAVLKALRKNYDYVVVDIWHSIEDMTLAVMDLSSTLIAVTTPEVTALRDTRRLVDMVQKRPDVKAKVEFVVNRYPSKSAVSLDKIERSLGAKPLCTIPSDGTLVTTAVNEGVSVLSKQGLAASSLMQLAGALVTSRVVPTERVTGPLTEKKSPLSLFKRTPRQESAQTS